MFRVSKRTSWVGMLALVLVGCVFPSSSDLPPENVPEEGESSESVETVPALELPEGDPGLLGPHAVGHTELTIADPDAPERMLETQVWYPAEAFDEE